MNQVIAPRLVKSKIFPERPSGPFFGQGATLLHPDPRVSRFKAENHSLRGPRNELAMPTSRSWKKNDRSKSVKIGKTGACPCNTRVMIYISIEIVYRLLIIEL